MVNRTQEARAWHSESSEAVLAALDAQKTGLTAGEAERRLWSKRAT